MKHGPNAAGELPANYLAQVWYWDQASGGGADHPQTDAGTQTRSTTGGPLEPASGVFTAGYGQECDNHRKKRSSCSIARADSGHQNTSHTTNKGDNRQKAWKEDLATTHN